MSKRFIRSVDENTVTELINDLYMNHPDKIDTMIKWYSKISGIDERFIDIRSAVRGYLCS